VTRPIDSPRPSVADVQRLSAAHLSLPSRIGHALLLVAALTVAAAVGSLLATESSLPLRTRVAFLLIVGIGLAWAVFAAWVLARRRVLFGTQRVVAARMGLVFSALCAIGMWAVGYCADFGRPAYVGALAESLLCVVAAVLLVKAHRRVQELSHRKRELERQLGIADARSSA
jgi:hypothetical protein